MEKFKAHILVVDDDDGIRELVKEYLSQNNYLVTSSNSAEDALEKVKIIKFDLIVLDIMMPGKSGLEFTKENKDKISTPIILLTAKGEASERIEGLDIGADEYLPKPFEPKELILRINNILNKTKYRNTKRKFKFGKIEIDLNKQFILKNEKSIKINNTEKIIFSALFILNSFLFLKIINLFKSILILSNSIILFWFFIDVFFNIFFILNNNSFGSNGLGR